MNDKRLQTIAWREIMNHDEIRHYRYAREHDRYQSASWPEPAWKSLLKIAGTIVGAVGVVGVFWILTVGIFLI